MIMWIKLFYVVCAYEVQWDSMGVMLERRDDGIHGVFMIQGLEYVMSNFLYCIMLFFLKKWAIFFSIYKITKIIEFIYAHTNHLVGSYMFDQIHVRCAVLTQIN